LLEVSTTGWLNAVTQGCSSLHAGQGWLFNESGVTVSFGLVRVANIRTAITLARHLSTSLSCDELAVKIACYHANDFLLSRFNKEHRLDHLLSRGAGNAAIEADAETRQEVKRASARGCKSLMFIVVATPVEEIGRDHDFDWAVIEPSSAQSVVQTAGRVNRHRMQPVAVPNIAVLQFNLKHCKNIENGKDNEAAFIHPGLESIGDDGSTHATHDMTELFVWSETGQLTVDARLRFDHEVSRFSAFDDTSMTCSLNKFFGCQIGSIRSMFDNENFAAQLIGQTVYDASPLRSKGNWNQVFFFTKLEGLAPVFLERLLDGNNVITLIPRSPSERDRNDWLVSSFEDMLSMCAELDVSPMQGTSLVISRYSQATNSNMEVVLDESYGAYRITHRAGG
ncbi:MAG: hypothetical protein ABIW96_00565, partial [Polaromonas sp.]